MAFFLKKSNLKKGVYLQIYESFYDPRRKGGAHRSYKALGYLDDLVKSGIADPIAFFQAEVDKLNQEKKKEKLKEKERQITDDTPEKLLGFVPLKNINDGLNVKKYLDILQAVSGLRFSLYDLISALVYARAVDPCSKLKTYEEVIPKLYGDYKFSLDQMYTGLEYIGEEYERIIEIYNHQISMFYPFDTPYTYFDCTNFYFEIDREDAFRRKGPSKENRKEPIVGMGLLLDSHQIPLGMKLYPGNQSEKPVIRAVIDGLKKRSNITGRTIQVADKGLNCADNIFHAVKDGDGYIFSKSVKQLPAVEKKWILLENDYRAETDSKGELLYRIKDCVDDFPYTITDEQGRKREVQLREKRVVTYNPQLAKKQQYEITRLVEKARHLSAYQARQSEYGECARYVTFSAADQTGKESDGKVVVTINEAAVAEAMTLAGYNLLVTSEIDLDARDIYRAYHNLWRIEESFRIMKSQLDARPVYLQKKETITGHFLICYLAVLLTRIFQFKVLENQFCSEEIFHFFREFKVAKISDKEFINLSKLSPIIQHLSNKTALPFTAYFLSDSSINKMLRLRF